MDESQACKNICSTQSENITFSLTLVATIWCHSISYRHSSFRLRNFFFIRQYILDFDFRDLLILEFYFIFQLEVRKKKKRNFYAPKAQEMGILLIQLLAGDFIRYLIFINFILFPKYRSLHRSAREARRRAPTGRRRIALSSRYGTRRPNSGRCDIPCYILSTLCLRSLPEFQACSH